MRKTYPALFGTSKPSRRKKNPRRPLLETLEERITPTVTLNSNFDGLTLPITAALQKVNGVPTGYVPPNSQGALGLNNTYIQTANKSVGIFNSSTQTLTADDSLDDFMHNVGGLAQHWVSQGQTQSTKGTVLQNPTVLFDEKIDRFIIGVEQVDQGSFGSFQGVAAFYLAVSKNGSPTDLTSANWDFYAMDISEFTPFNKPVSFFPDFWGSAENFGYNADAIVLSFNEFNLSTLGSTLVANHVQVQVIDVNNLLSGQLKYYHSDVYGEASMRPTAMHDAVAGDSMWFVADGQDGKHIDVWRMDNPDTSDPTYTEFQLNVDPFYEVGLPPPSGFGTAPSIYGLPLEPNGQIITINQDSEINKSAEMNDLIAASQEVTDATGFKGIARWYEIEVTGNNPNTSSATPFVQDQGNVTAPTTGAGQPFVYDEYPVVDINQFGDIAMTFTQSGENSSYPPSYMFESDWVTGRLFADPPGTMETPVPVQLGGGNNPYYYIPGVQVGYEGHTNAIQLAPGATDGTFWASTEWYDNNGFWNEEVANVSVNTFPTIVDLTGGDLTVTNTQYNVGNNLTITEVTNPAGQAPGTYVEISDSNPAANLGATGAAIQGSTSTVYALLSSVNEIDVGPNVGLDGGTVANPDSLTIDYSGGNFNQVPISYDGGGPDGSINTLTLQGGSFNTAVYTYNNDGHSGNFDFDGQTIVFSNLASITDTNTNVNDTFDPPAGSDLSFAQSGSNPALNELVPLNGTTVDTNFADPSATFTVNTVGGSQVELGAMDATFNPSQELLIGKIGDLFQFTAAGAVPSATTLTLSAATLDLNGLSPTLVALDGTGLVTDSQTKTTSTLTLGLANGSGLFTGIIQNGSGTVALTKIGTGTATLGGVSTYGGATTISAGTLQAGITNAIPSTSDVFDTATFDLNGFSDTVGALFGTGLVTSSAAGKVTITVGGTGNSASFNGLIQDGSGIVALGKVGAGTETLTTFNTYSGNTSINGGTLSVATDSYMGTAPPVSVLNEISIANGATLLLTNPAALTINPNRGLFIGLGGGIVDTAGGTIYYAGVISGGNTLTKSGPADLYLQNDATLSTPGAVDVNVGRLFFSSQNALGTTAVTVAGSTTLDYTGAPNVSLINPVILTNNSDVASRGGTLTLSALTQLPTTGLIKFNFDDQPTNSVVDLGGDILTNTLTMQVGGLNTSVGSATIVGQISGNAGITKTGQYGTLILAASGGNTYSGTTLVSAGTLALGANNTMPTGAGKGNVDVASGAIFDMGGFSTIINGLVGSGTVDNSGGGATTLTVGNNNISTTFPGTIKNSTGTLGLTKTGTGTFTLSGSNTYAGTTTVKGGVLQAGLDDAFPATSDITDNATLDLNGHLQVVGSLAGVGFVTSSVTGSVTLTIDATGDNGTFTGGIQNGSGTIALSKIGAGTEIIGGITNSYTGTTAVTAGTLEVDGSIVSNVSMSGSGTLDGIGSVGNVTATHAANISPGNPLGSLTTGALNLQAGTDVNAVLGGDVQGNYSQLNLTSGSVTLDSSSGGVPLDLSTGAGFLPTVSDEYVLLNNNTSTPITGTFVAGTGSTLAPGTPLTEGTVISTNFFGIGLPATITYQAGPNHDSVAIIVQPDILVNVSNPSLSITNGGPVSYSLNYFDYGSDFKLSTLSIANVHLITTGTAFGVLNFDTGTGATRTITITNIQGNGSLAISVDAGSGQDFAGNQSLGSGLSTAFIVYNNAPVVSVSNPSANYAAGGPITYSVTYADPYFSSSNLTPADIVLNGTGTANASTVSVSGGGKSYLVTLSGLTGNGSLGISIAAGTAVDLAGNVAGTGGPSRTFVVDNTPPTITIGNPSANYAAHGPITYTVTYASAYFGASDLVASDITLDATGTATGNIGVTGSGRLYTVTISSITGDGTLGIAIAGGTANDLAGNTAPASGASATFIVDNTAPAVSISVPSANYAAAGPITYNVSYTDLNFRSSNLVAADVVLDRTGTANGVVAVSGSGTSYTVTINNIVGSGTLGISLLAGTAVDQAGNLAPATGPSSSFVVDNTPPTVSVSAPSVSIANTAAGSVTYNITYADANFNTSTLTTANITLNKTGTANGVVGVTGSGLSYTVTIGSLSGNGTLGITIAANTASDLAGNEAPASAPSTTFIVDNRAPTVTIGAPSINYAAAGPITYTVTYRDANFGSSSLTTGNITLNATGSANGNVSVSGSGTSYTVSITNLSGDGTLGFTIAAGSAVDLAGNTAAGASSGTFVVDTTPPSISIGGPSATLTNTGPIIYTITYGGDNFASSTLSTADVSLVTTGSATGTLSFDTGTGTTRTVTITNIQGNGTLGIAVASGSAVDLAGNPAPAATSGTFVVDNTAVGISISAPSKSITNTAGGPIAYTISYIDPVFGSSNLSSADVQLITTGTATGTLSFDPTTGSTRTVTITNISGDGTLGIAINAGSAIDLAGNTAPAATSGTFTVDNTPPGLTISAPSKLITNTAGGPITYSISYADTNFGSSSLTLADISLIKTGTATGTLSLSGSGTSYTVTISNPSGDGTLAFSIASGTAVDQANNLASGRAASPSRWTTRPRPSPSARHRRQARQPARCPTRSPTPTRTSASAT